MIRRQLHVTNMTLTKCPSSVSEVVVDDWEVLGKVTDFPFGKLSL